MARQLSHEHFNSFRVGEGATKYALVNGFEMRNMLTDRAKLRWQKRLKEIQEAQISHTTGTIRLAPSRLRKVVHGSSHFHIRVFMKKAGRVGDSPLSGSGFYVDSEIGGAAATGLGEDIMKGCISYEIVRRMAEGETPQDACDHAVYPFVEKLKRRYGKAVNSH